MYYHQTWARKSHEESAVRFVAAKSWPETEPPSLSSTLRPRVGQKKPPRFGSTICYGQEWARKSHRNSAVRFVTAKSWPKRATKTRQYDLFRPRIDQKKPPRLGSTICCGQELAKRVTETRQYDSLRCYGRELARSSHQDSAVRFVAAKSWYDLLRSRVGQKQPSKLGSSIFLWPRVGQNEAPRLGSAIRYRQTWSRKSHQDSARQSHRDSTVRFIMAESWPEKATKTARKLREFARKLVDFACKLLVFARKLLEFARKPREFARKLLEFALSGILFYSPSRCCHRSPCANDAVSAWFLAVQ